MPKKPIKPFITYSDQINILTQTKQLNISDLSYAEGKLHDIGYYSLIDGYKDIFYNPMTRTYVKGTNFADIVALYEFDENLRSLVFKYICHIEQKIRSLISYSFCEAFSENQSAYLNSANYNVSNKNSRDISKLISILTYEANQNIEHSYMVYQRNTYGNVPLWVIMKTLTLGQTSKMYSFMLPSIKSKVSVHYGNITEKEYDVVGPICESSDVFGKNVMLNEVKRGDIFALRSAGAYGEVMSSMYNLRKLPQAYFSEDFE